MIQAECVHPKSLQNCMLKKIKLVNAVGLAITFRNFSYFHGGMNRILNFNFCLYHEQTFRKTCIEKQFLVAEASL